MLFEKLDSIPDAASRQIIEQPVHVATVVFHTFRLTKGLCHVETAFLVNAKRDRIGDTGLCREQLALNSARDLEAMQRECPFLGLLCDLGRIRLLSKTGGYKQYEKNG